VPVYEFYCAKCNAIDEVVRPVSEATNVYHCPECGGKTKKHYTVPQTIVKGEQIPYFHPAFGKVMTDNQAKEEAKKQGLIEIGNENPHKHIESPKPQSYDSPDYFL